MTIEEMKKVKEERGYSFDVLSAYSRVPRATIVRIFDGTTKRPRRETLEALERVLGEDEYRFPGKNLHFGLDEDHPEFNILMDPKWSKAFWLAEHAANDYNEEGFITVQEFLNMSLEGRTELINGEIIVMEDPRFVHSEIAQYVYDRFSEFRREKKGSCRPVLSGTNVILGRYRNRDSVLCPDFFVICDTSKIIRKGVKGGPDFVLEVTSPTNQKRDLIEKLPLYMHAGVREYWIISPQKKILIRYLAENEGVQKICPLTGRAGVAIYNNELEIDLDEIAEIIAEDELREEE